MKTLGFDLCGDIWIHFVWKPQDVKELQGRKTESASGIGVTGHGDEFGLKKGRFG